MGEFARCGGRPGALPPGPRDLGNAPTVGKRPGDTRRHTGGKLPHRKNRVKLLFLGAVVGGSAQIISVRTLTANSTKATMTTGRTIFAPLRMVNPAPT